MEVSKGGDIKDEFDGKFMLADDEVSFFKASYVWNSSFHFVSYKFISSMDKELTFHYYHSYSTVINNFSVTSITCRTRLYLDIVFEYQSMLMRHFSIVLDGLSPSLTQSDSNEIAQN